MRTVRSLYHRIRPLQQGFTLLEILIVLIVIGLTGSVVMMNTKRQDAKPTPDIVDFIEKERTASLLSGQTTQIQLQDDGLYATASQHRFPILKIKLNSGEQYLPTKTLVTFYPDGTQSKSSFTLTKESTSYEINTTPFNNKIQYTEHKEK